MAIQHPAASKLKERFPALAFKGNEFKGDVQIIVPTAALAEVVAYLRSEPTLAYDHLVDVTCVDYLQHVSKMPGRFGLVYVLASTSGVAPRLILRVFVDETNLEVASLVPQYAGAEWLEREVYDMFGIQFTGHPDLRRILTWEGFKAHALRKDYPVTGQGEREQYPVIDRTSA